MTPAYEGMRAGYGKMWSAARIRPERRQAAFLVAQAALRNRGRYAQAAAVAPGMPWAWVAAVHSLEASASWTAHLHNGDPLTARTVHVPAGRPAAGSPPFTWEASAADALLLKGLDRVQSWEVERQLYELERYNGFGYIARRVNSPYLWSFTDQYQSGKYVADGRFDAAAVSKQCGAVAILKAVGELEAAGEHDITIDRKAMPAPLPAAPGLMRRVLTWIGF